MAPFFLMPRVFEFEMMLREDVVSAERMPRLRAFLSTLGIELPGQGSPALFAPVSLRWRVSPQIGAPRVPFEVWRRPIEKRGPHRSLPVNITITTDFTFEWGAIPLIELVCTASPAAGASLRLQALDDHLDPLVGEQVIVSATQPVRFHTPNICALRIIGNGTVSNFELFTMSTYANDGGWELIETVGLPFHLNETPDPVYDSREQGFPSVPKSGFEASRDRLIIGVLMALSPPNSAPDGLPVPNWPEPDLNELLFAMREAPDSPLQLIREMLETVDPSSFEQAQIDYRRSISTDGFSQPGTGVSSEPGEAQLAVSPLMLISAGTDNWTSLSLGFGTTTFAHTAVPDPKVIVPDRLPAPEFDYMVSATYHLPFGLEINLAAIAALARVLPIPPNALAAETYQRQRPVTRDGVYGEDVSLRWLRVPRQAPPHGYALAIRFGGGTPEILNEKQTSTSFTPFLPAQRPDGDINDELFVHFVDTMRDVPLTGSRTDHYLAAALDVFGRWSAWRVTNFTVNATPPLRPQILSGGFDLNIPAASGRAIPADLDIELAWDWEDRSPQEIQLVGAFYDPAGTPPVSAPGGLQFTPGGPLSTAATISFSTAGVPTLNAGSGSVIELTPEPGDGESRRYKVVLTGYTADFTSTSRLAYAIYVRGRERVNPAVFSDFSPPGSARVNDPLPADVPVVPPVIHWTALPDATGIARARLTFPAVAHAAGYIMYEASETALRDLAGLNAPDSDLITRATEVLSIAGTPAATDAFARVGREIFPAPVAEVRLPGTVDGLFLYTVASVTAEQVESERSAPMLVAVSRRITPGTPRLHARAEADGIHIRVESVPEAPAAGVALSRTQSDVLAVDLDLMGPPVVDPDSAAWTIAANVFTLTDAVSPSWRPYYYRAVAFGPNDAANGRLPGRSGPSGAVDVLIPPSDPPDLQPIEQLMTASSTLVRIHVRSLAETRVTPLGVHHIEFLTLDRSVPVPTPTLHARADLNVIPATPASPAEEAGTVTRGPRDVNGRWLYESYVPADDNEVIVRMIDPLGRVTEQRAPITSTPPPPPPPDLTGFDGRAILCLMTVRVSSNEPINVPFFGSYKLELFNITGGANTLMASALLHTIGTTRTLGRFWRSGPDANGRFIYTITLTIIPGSVQRVRVRLTNPVGEFSEVEGDV
jgi:hypothetical protein